MNRLERRLLTKKKPILNQALSELLQLAENKYLKGELKDASELCQEASALSPLDAKPFHLLALIYLQQGDFTKSGKNILEAITRNDTDTNIHSDCSAIMNILGRFQEAEAASRHAIDLKSKNCDAYCNLAVSLQMQKRTQEAKDVFVNTLKKHPNNERLRANFGNFLFFEEEIISSIEEFTKVLKIFPNNILAQATMALALEKVGEFKAAQIIINNAYKENQKDPNICYAYGCVSLSQGLFERAKEAFKSAKRIQPLFAVSEIGLAKVSLAIGDAKNASKHIQKALQLDPKSGESYLLLIRSRNNTLNSKEKNSVENIISSNSIKNQQKIYAYRALGESAILNKGVLESLNFFDSAKNLHKEMLIKNEIFFSEIDFKKAAKRLQDFSNIAKTSGRNYNKKSDVKPVFVMGSFDLGSKIIAESLSEKLYRLPIPFENLLEDFPNCISDMNEAKVDSLRDEIHDYYNWQLNEEIMPVFINSTNLFSMWVMKVLFQETKIVFFKSSLQQESISSYFYNYDVSSPWSTSKESIKIYYKVESEVISLWQSLFPSSYLELDILTSFTNWQSSKKVIEKFLNKKPIKNLNNSLKFNRLETLTVVP